MQTSNAIQFKVYYKTGPNTYALLADAVVTNITINDFNTYSQAAFNMNSTRAGDPLEVTHGSRIKIIDGDGIVRFMGVIVSNPQSASGTSGGGTSYEQVSFKAFDYRWAINRRAVVTGIHGHGYDDYDFSGFDPASSSSIIASTGSYTYFSGKRAIFNPHGKANCSTAPITGEFQSGSTAQISLFVEEKYGQRWSARKMIMYLLFFGWSNFKELYDVDGPDDFDGLDNEEFDKTPWHIAIEGLRLMDAIYVICQEVDMRFREVYSGGEPRLQFYKPRLINSNNCQFKQLYCPGVGENFDGDEPYPCWSFSVETDSSKIITAAIGTGAPERYEITTELVPSFSDSIITTTPSPSFVDDDTIAASTNPNASEVFAKFDSRGANFQPEAFRLWTLNETGKYSFDPYDRGLPPDLADLIGDDATDSSGKARFGLFNRPLLPALTQLGLTEDSSGIKVEFSFDGGSSWGPLSCGIINIEDSGGIWISEPNLHNLKPPGEQTITGGDLDGVEGSFLTSVMSDILAGHVFRLSDDDLPSEETNWNTRIRVTCCIEIEQRPVAAAAASSEPLYREVYDFSGRYRYWQRSQSSLLTAAADTNDDTSQLAAQVDTIFSQNQSVRAAGTFTLATINFDFNTGDIIGGITGRGISLGAQSTPDANGDVWATGAEIVQIIHEPLTQTTRLITADDRFTE